MNRVFLDANVLVSAALTPASGLHDLWSAPAVRLLASPHVVEEARRNVRSPEARARLEQLLARVAVLDAEPAPMPVTDASGLPVKDVPVLVGAVAAGAGFLLTGDITHFGSLMGQRAAGVLVLLPGEYLRRHLG